MSAPTHVRRWRACGMMLLSSLFVLLLAAPAPASHGPTRSGGDVCNGTAAFDVNNVITREVVDAVASQNPGAQNPDGTIDRSEITHAVLNASGHVSLQVREKPGAPLARVTFEFSAADSAWAGDSTRNPGYLTAIDASEDPARDADSDLVVGRTFLFPIPTDVVGDGNYVARLRGFRADGTEAGRLCVDAVVSNGQSQLDAGNANTDPAYEPTENSSAAYGYSPQPVTWFPAAEPSTSQQAGYGASVARIEFLEPVPTVKVEREEIDPLDPTQRIWVDYTAGLQADDFTRPHFLAGGRMDGTGLESSANEKVWGPGFRFDLGSLPGANPPAERLRVSATDSVGKSFCGIYTFSAGANSSFVPSAPAAC